MCSLSCQFHITDLFHVPVSASSVLCLSCGLQAARHPTSEALFQYVCMWCFLKEDDTCMNVCLKVCLIYFACLSVSMVGSRGVLPSLSHAPYGNTLGPSVHFSLCFRGLEENKHPLPSHRQKKNPHLSDEGIFWLSNHLHIPIQRPGAVQLGPIKCWMKDWGASFFCLIDGILYCFWRHFSPLYSFIPCHVPFIEVLKALLCDSEGRLVDNGLQENLRAFLCHYFIIIF